MNEDKENLAILEIGILVYILSLIVMGLILLIEYFYGPEFLINFAKPLTIEAMINGSNIDCFILTIDS
ncbi:MAG: hypothetical protein ACO2ON_00995 [Candidatus Nanopusillus sp.]